MADIAEPTPHAGRFGVALGGMALIFVVVHYVAGPFAPQQDVGVSLGELAAQIGKSAVRDTLGLSQPAPEPLPWDLDRVLTIAAVIVAGLALLLAVVGFVRRENRTLAMAAACFGGAAIAIQLFATTVVMILCTAVILGLFWLMREAIAEISPF